MSDILLPDRLTAAPEMPQQAKATEGLAPLTRPSLITRCFMAVVAQAERLNLAFARHGNPPVYDVSVFPWAQAVAGAAPDMRQELERVLQRKSELPNFHDIASDVKAISNDGNWKTYFLLAFGERSERNIAACPRTWAAVSRIPGLKTAMFSIFEPGKHLQPHRGPYNGVLRLHVGLIVPEVSDRLAIRVHDRLCHWQEGQALIFDDAYEHEAWNHTDRTRVVLFCDFVKPLNFPANLVNWLLLNLAVFTPFIREGLDKHKQWEQRFYAEAEALRNRKPH